MTVKRQTIWLAIFLVTYITVGLLWLESGQDRSRQGQSAPVGDLVDSHGRPMLLEDYLKMKGKLPPDYHYTPES